MTITIRRRAVTSKLETKSTTMSTRSSSPYLAIRSALMSLSGVSGVSICLLIWLQDLELFELDLSSHLDTFRFIFTVFLHGLVCLTRLHLWKHTPFSSFNSRSCWESLFDLHHEPDDAFPGVSHLLRRLYGT